MVTRGKQHWTIIIIISDGSYNECTRGKEPLPEIQGGAGASPPPPHFCIIVHCHIVVLSLYKNINRASLRNLWEHYFLASTLCAGGSTSPTAPYALLVAVAMQPHHCAPNLCQPPCLNMPSLPLTIVKHDWKTSILTMILQITDYKIYVYFQMYQVIPNHNRIV